MLTRMAEDPLYMLAVLRPEDCRVPFAQVHREVVQQFMDDTLRFQNFILPRAHAKSSIVVRAGALWHLFLEDMYYDRERTRKFIVICSRTQDLSISHMSWLKEVIQTSPAFHHFFGDWFTTAKQWTKYRLELKDASLVVPKGMGQQYVGLNWKGQRPTLALNDDLEDAENTATDRSLEENFSWLVRDVEPAVDPQIGRVVVVGTPKHRNCIVERLDRPGSGYASMRRGAILDENTPNERALWEAWKPLSALKADRMRARANGKEAEWVQEMLCKVTSDKGDFANIHYWDGTVRTDAYGNQYLVVTHRGGPETKGDLALLTELDEPEIIPVNTFLGFDPAIGTSARADDAVCLVRGVCPEGKTYTIDLWAKKGATVEEQAQVIIQRARMYNVKYTAVETVAYQEALRQRVQQLMREEGIYLTGIESKNNPRKKKKGEDSRLEEMQPDFVLGRMVFKASHTKLRDQALDYPYGSDDALDALYYSRVRSYPPTHGAEMLSEKKDKPKPGIRRRAFDARKDWMLP